MKDNIYLILFDWSTTDSDGIETYLYRDYENARRKFDELITSECDADMSWVGSEAFDENGNVTEDYELDSNADDITARELYWHIADKSDYTRRSFIDLLVREIH